MLPSSRPASLPQGRPDRQGHGHPVLGTAADAERERDRLRAAVPDKYADAALRSPPRSCVLFRFVRLFCFLVEDFRRRAEGPMMAVCRPPTSLQLSTRELARRSLRPLPVFIKKKAIGTGPGRSRTRVRSCSSLQWPSRVAGQRWHGPHWQTPSPASPCPKALPSSVSEEKQSSSGHQDAGFRVCLSETLSQFLALGLGKVLFLTKPQFPHVISGRSNYVGLRIKQVDGSE